MAKGESCFHGFQCLIGTSGENSALLKLDAFIVSLTFKKQCDVIIGLFTKGATKNARL